MEAPRHPVGWVLHETAGSSPFLQNIASETDAAPFTLMSWFSDVCQTLTYHLQSRKSCDDSVSQVFL